MTAQFESDGVSNYFDPEKSKARGRSFVKMRVKARNIGNLTLPHGNLVQPGVREIYCYDDEVATVMALVEAKPANIAVARDRYMLEIAKQVNELLDPAFTGTMEEFAKLLDAGKAGELAMAALKKVLETTPSSPEGAFYDLTGRGLQPLESAEVIETGITEPQREALKAEQDKQAAVMAQALAIALKQVLAPSGDEKAATKPK